MNSFIDFMRFKFLKGCNLKKMLYSTSLTNNNIKEEFIDFF